MEMREFQEGEFRRKRTKSERTETMLQMFVRLTSEDKIALADSAMSMVAEKLTVAPRTIQERGTKPKR